VNLPVIVRLPAGGGGWTLALAGSAVSIGDLAALNGLMGGANSGFPTGVIGIGGFQVTRLRLDFAAASAKVWHLRTGFAVGQPGANTWSILNGLFAIGSVNADLNLTLYTSGSVQALASGSISGQLTVAGVALDVAVNLPRQPDGYLLTASASIPNFSLSSLSGWMGGSADPLTALLASLGMGTLTLDYLGLLFDPDGTESGLHRIDCTLEVATWSVPSLSWLVVDSVVLDLSVEDPTLSTRNITGQAAAQLSLGGYSLAAQFSFADAHSWTLEL
jgi:hypothetical protein